MGTQISRLFFMGCFVLFVAGCASTTIYPEANGNYSLVTTSSDQGYAEKDAKKKAEEHCAQMGRGLVVVSHQTKYQGADKNNVAVIGMATTLLTGNHGNPARSNQDYQVTMRFRCQ